MVERESNRIMLYPVKDREEKTLVPLIKRHCEENSIIYSDGWPAFQNLNDHGYSHFSVVHKEGFTATYKNDNTGEEVTVNTNKIEGAWDHAKNHFRKIYGASARTFYGHLCEIIWRNHHAGKNVVAELLNRIVEIYDVEEMQDSVARENDNHQQVDKPFHPPKHFVFPKKKCGSRERSCQHAWFETYDWLHYDESTQSVFCHYCMVQERKGNLKDQGSKEDAYITKGFSSWKKAPKCFQAHQDSACHKTAQTYQLTIPKCLDVEEMIDNQLTEKRTVERKYLLQVIRCLRYLARQGIALQGDDGNDNFTQLLHLVGISDENLMKHLDGKIGSKYTHSDVQNELLNIMATLTLLEKLKDIDERRFFSMIADEGTDISNKEQLSFCLRTVDENLEAYEDFIGFHQLENIKSDVIVRVIKDILLRLNLSLENCRGQTYDGASNMMGRKSGVSTQILAEQPKAVAIHCEGHSLSLSIKSLTSECDTLKDTLSVVKEICVLVKYSPKRENLLGNIHESIEKGDVRCTT
ncbi:zinc finger MYM-type protein 1-like [Clytia hemisphaerica]|uniref:zinc finger MYM-type protein 1-like n=1 Tax=Clytia hemisphaerica TaxID=252671 RepID=UPI0034D7811E